jgi:predicted nucleotidyltransferase
MSERLEVVYNNKHWAQFSYLRGEALKMMKPLHEANIDCIVYGSVARGDVSRISDVDVFLPTPPSPPLIESRIESAGLQIIEREIIQATPGYVPKAYVYLNELRSFSFPLVKLLQSEIDFYHFAGSLQFKGLEGGKRVPGVNKQLILIEPTSFGHIESTIKNREGEVARILGINTRIVLERIRTLERRRGIGRTGVFLKYKLSPEEGFGDALENLSRTRPGLRKRMKN